MSWGNKLLLVFIGFALLMGTLVYKCTQQTFELVSNDYYGDELRYQDNIDGSNNANKLSELTIDQTEHQLVVQLPKEQHSMKVTGKLWFYCADNASNDRKLLMETNSDGAMVIDKTKLAKTNYQVKVSWLVGQQKFYKEVNIDIQ